MKGYFLNDLAKKKKKKIPWPWINSTNTNREWEMYIFLVYPVISLRDLCGESCPLSPARVQSRCECLWVRVPEVMGLHGPPTAAYRHRAGMGVPPKSLQPSWGPRSAQNTLWQWIQHKALPTWTMTSLTSARCDPGPNPWGFSFN